MSILIFLGCLIGRWSFYPCPWSELTTRPSLFAMQNPYPQPLDSRPLEISPHVGKQHVKLVILDRDVGIPPPRADADIHRNSFNRHIADRERFADGIVVALQLCCAGVALEIAVLERRAGIQTPFFTYQPHAVYARPFFQHRTGIDVLRAAQFLIGRYAQQGFTGGIPVCRDSPCEAVEIGAWFGRRNKKVGIVPQGVFVLAIDPTGLTVQLQLAGNTPVSPQVVFGLLVAVVSLFDSEREGVTQALGSRVFGIDPSDLRTQATALGRAIG